MLPKKQRLTGKDIQYILRRGGKMYGKRLVFRVIPQYANNAYNQRSIQIPIKLDKRATMRNLLKRHALQVVEEIQTERSYRGPYFKVFVFVNKQSLDPLKELIATGDKRHIVKSREDGCKQEFTLFFERVGHLLTTHGHRGSRTGSQRGKTGRKRK